MGNGVGGQTGNGSSAHGFGKPKPRSGHNLGTSRSDASPKVLIHHRRMTKPLTLRMGPRHSMSPNVQKLDKTTEQIHDTKEKDELSEILEWSGHALDAEEKVTDAAAAYFLKTSFRSIHFHAIWELEPKLNRVNNLTGMVTNAVGSTRFRWLKGFGEGIGRVAKPVAFALEAWKLRYEYRDMLESNLTPEEKIDRSGDFVVSIASRVATGTIADIGHAGIWIAKHVSHMDMSYPEDRLAHVENFLTHVTDPNEIHKQRVYIRTNIHVPMLWPVETGLAMGMAVKEYISK